MEKAQTGRSMVEMLGVLAITGVLSIGGIYGYSTAMTKHRSNELLEEINRRATSVAAQVFSGNTPNLREFGNNLNYAEFLDDVEVLNGQFVIHLQNVDETICKIVKNSVGTSTIVRSITDDCTGLTFNNDLSTTDEGGGNCGYCQHFENGECVADTTCENGCFGSHPILTPSGTCNSCPRSSNDPSFSAASASECSKCSWGSNSYTYDEANHRCVIDNSSCPDGQGYWLDGSTCRDCSGNWTLHSLTASRMQDCLTKCPNRVRGNDGWGAACVLDNYCTGPNQFIDGWGTCQTCGEVNQYWDPDWGPCAQCPGISFSLMNYGDDCVIDCPNNNYGKNVGRCCNSQEVYTDIGRSSYGHQYGACCPLARPVWNGSSCISS